MNKLLSLVGVMALCASCATGAKTAPPREATPAGVSTVVARIGDQAITLAELDKAAAADLYEARQKALDTMITERVLEPEAKKAGLSVEDFVRKQVEAKVPMVGEAEARDFFEKNKAHLPPQFADKKFEDVKDMIIQGLTGQKRQEAVGSVIDELRAKAGVKILLEAPKVEVAATGPSRGPANAKVTIVEFSDFQCPYCAHGRQTIDQVMKAYDGKVRVVFRDFPLSFHEHAEKAAEAGQCANEQGKFWEMHDWMFDNQGSLTLEGLQGAAQKLGLDSAKFNACLSSGKFASTVAANQKAGEAAGVRGTPAFFINGVFLNGAQPFDKFKEEIDRLLAN